MIKLLFGTWPRRILTVVACLVSFALSLTLALVMAVQKSPASAAAVQRVPLVGGLAVKVAGVSGDRAEKKDAFDAGEDVKTFRDIRPLSAEEISELIQDLRQQRDVYMKQGAAMKREQKRLSMYRIELTKEREALDRLRKEIASEWEELKKARASLEQEVAVMRGDETGNLKKLAQQYESMKPEKAAPIITQLPENTAAKVLFLMRERNVAKIMEQLDQGAAARLSEKMAMLKATN